MTQTPFVIRDSKRARAIASPVRQEIVDALESAGASTIAAIALALERRPDALYFHVRALEQAGLIRRTGTTGEGRQRAAVFDVPGRPVRLDYGGTPASRSARLGPALDSLLRVARRDVRRALGSAGSRGEGETRDLWVARVRGRIGPKDLRRINGLLEQCAQIVRDAEASPEAVPIALAFALTPLSASQPRKSRPSSGSGRPGSSRRLS